MSTNVFELPAHDGEAARELTPADWARLERNAAEILAALGLDLDTPGTRDTPRRFVQALYDATAGYDGDPKLRTVFPTERPEGVEGRHAQIVEGPVGFYALCEHHALPFHGRAYVGYVAGDEILGISKLTRLVRLYARRFTVQERMAEEIADGLRELAGARGVAVRLEAAHMCTAMRGVEEDGSLTVTTVWRGLYDEDDSLRSEFLTSDPVIESFRVLAEDEDLPRWDVPEQLVELYGGAIGLEEPCVVANFVESLDGVVAVPRLPRSHAVHRRRERGGPVRARPRARVRRCGRRRLRHAARLAAGDVADRSRVSAGRRGAGRAAGSARPLGAAPRRGRHHRRLARSGPRGARVRRARAHDRGGGGRPARVGAGRERRSSP